MWMFLWFCMCMCVCVADTNNKWLPMHTRFVGGFCGMILLLWRTKLDPTSFSSGLDYNLSTDTLTIDQNSGFNHTHIHTPFMYIYPILWLSNRHSYSNGHKNKTERMQLIDYKHWIYGFIISPTANRNHIDKLRT